jgi:hypothetical protein
MKEPPVEEDYAKIKLQDMVVLAARGQVLKDSIVSCEGRSIV